MILCAASASFKAFGFVGSYLRAQPCEAFGNIFTKLSTCTKQKIGTFEKFCSLMIMKKKLLWQIQPEDITKLLFNCSDLSKAQF